MEKIINYGPFDKEFNSELHVNNIYGDNGDIIGREYGSYTFTMSGLTSDEVAILNNIALRLICKK